MPTRESTPAGAPCWVDLYTSDPDRAIAFYSELFGWDSTTAGPEYGGYITFTRDGALVAGAMRNDGSEGSPDTWTVYLAVDDAASTSVAAKDHGGQVYVEPMDIPAMGVMGLVADAGGAAIGLWQPGGHHGFGVVAEPGAPAWFELHTRAYPAAVTFYEDVFGWDTSTVSDTPEFRYTTLGEGEDAAAGVIDASGFLPDGAPSHWTVYFAADDTDAVTAQAVGLGATVVMPAEDTPYGRLAVLADPTGANFRLVGPNTKD